MECETGALHKNEHVKRNISCLFWLVQGKRVCLGLKRKCLFHFREHKKLRQNFAIAKIIPFLQILANFCKFFKPLHAFALVLRIFSR